MEQAVRRSIIILMEWQRRFSAVGSLPHPPWNVAAQVAEWQIRPTFTRRWLPASLPMLHRLWFELPADELDGFGKHNGSDGEWPVGLGGGDSHDLSQRALHSMLNAWAIWRIVVLSRWFAVNCAAGAPVVSGDGGWLRHIG